MGSNCFTAVFSLIFAISRIGEGRDWIAPLKNERNRMANPNERLIRLLQATPEQQAVIDRILEGKMETAPRSVTGPLLLPMGKASELLGVSRPTLWRMLNAGRLARVEVLPKTYRVRRSEIEALVNGKCNEQISGS